MQIKLLFFAQMREAAGAGERTVVVESPITVGECVRGVLAQPEFTKVRDLPFRYAINDEFVGSEQAVEDGSVLAILPPVAGG
jgi:molybdopterin converting factor small subunit